MIGTDDATGADNGTGSTSCAVSITDGPHRFLRLLLGRSAELEAEVGGGTQAEIEEDVGRGVVMV